MYDNEVREYVNILREALRPLRDFGGIEYADEAYKGAEYIKMWDIMGGTIFLDVTGYKPEHVMRDVFTIALGGTPKSAVHNIESKREIARLFLK